MSAPIHRATAFAKLTRHEAAIVARLLDGATYAEIAAQRKRSRRTVANQVSSILRKIGAGSSRELLVMLQEF